MKTINVLKKDTRCCSCHESMKAGELFKWSKKQIYATGKVTDFGKTVFRPAHVNNCVIEKFERICKDQDERIMDRVKSKFNLEN